jgi:GT2 family glycosyltransferase
MIKNLQASIIIANNSKNPLAEKFLSCCITSIKKNTKIPYEILIKDGAITGPAKARNIAAKRGRGKYLLFLDYDTIISSTILHRTVEYLDKHPKIGGGQLKLLRMDRKNIFDSAGDKLTPFGFLAERAQEAIDNGQFDKVEPIFSGKGAAMIVRRDIFEKVGGFDEDYFMYWEEPDLTWRIWKAGYKFVFLPMGTVYHAYGSKEKKVSRKWDIEITYLGCRNHIATIIKNGVGLQGLKMLLSVTTAWLVFLLLFLVKLDFAKAKAILRAYLWLILNLKKLLNKRQTLQKKFGNKFFMDQRWMEKVKDNRNLNWYIGKGLSYVLGKPF